jgi:HTH-type transcriptional regulator, sugar sensing transcriptional regulator
MLEKYLQEIGLSDKESLVYAALLHVDNDSVLDLSKKTKINRTTIYPVLDSLAKKGLISEVKIDKKIRYHAEPPERLETYVERQKVVLDEQSKRLKDIIPQLKSVQRESGERPIVKYFEGREGIISSLEEFFRSEDIGGVTHLVYPRDLLLGLFTDKEQEKYRKLRISRGIKSKALYTSDQVDRPSDATGDRIKIDSKKYPITCDINVYQDRVRINTLGSALSGISIISKDLADTLRSLIDLVFDKSTGK